MPAPRGFDDIYRGEISRSSLEVLSEALEDLRAAAGITDAILLVQLPFWSPLALRAGSNWRQPVIYDCMDEHSAFPGAGPATAENERALIAGSQLVVAANGILFEKIRPLARRSVLIPNAVDFDHFSRPPAEHPLGSMSRPIVGYYGALSEWFDVEMIYEAALARPSWQFVLIGKLENPGLSALRRLKNVRLLGEQPYGVLPSYLHDFDVACIPFRLTRVTRATDPVKFYEYLAAGKPVVTTALPELAQYRDHCYFAHSPADFVHQIERALAENSTERAAYRIEFARSNTWEDRFEKLAQAMQETQ